MHKCSCIFLRFMLNNCTLWFIHIFAALVVNNIIVMFSSVWPYKAYIICNFQHSFNSFICFLYISIFIYIYLFINVVGHHIYCWVIWKSCRGNSLNRCEKLGKPLGISTRKWNCKMISASQCNEDRKFVKFITIFVLHLFFSISKT